MNQMDESACMCLDVESLSLSGEDAMCLCIGDSTGEGEAIGKAVIWAVAKAEDLGEKGEAIKEAVDKAMVVVKSLKLESLRDDLKGRGNVVMTRVADEDLDVMDTLVEAGLFDSRSECAAFLIREGIESRGDLVDRVEDTAKKIASLKEELKKGLS